MTLYYAVTVLVIVTVLISICCNYLNVNVYMLKLPQCLNQESGLIESFILFTILHLRSTFCVTLKIFPKHDIHMLKLVSPQLGNFSKSTLNEDVIKNHDLSNAVEIQCFRCQLILGLIELTLFFHAVIFISASELLAFMTSGAILAIEMLGDNAVERWLKMIGPTDSARARKCEPHTIRARFGTGQ